MDSLEDKIRKIREIEEFIEETMWISLDNENYEKALRNYEQAKNDLESLEGLNGETEKEQKRVLSYCLMRINDALESLDRSEGSIERAEGVLKLAKESGDSVQVLRSKLALGVALLNSGMFPEAEAHFTDIILQTQYESEDEDVIQVYGWTLIVRANILLGKSLYSQAEEVANKALSVLSGIENYAGLRTVYSLLSRIYQAEGVVEKAESCKLKSQKYGKLAKEHRQ